MLLIVNNEHLITPPLLLQIRCTQSAIKSLLYFVLGVLEYISYISHLSWDVFSKVDNWYQSVLTFEITSTLTLFLCVCVCPSCAGSTAAAPIQAAEFSCCWSRSVSLSAPCAASSSCCCWKVESVPFAPCQPVAGTRSSSSGQRSKCRYDAFSYFLNYKISFRFADTLWLLNTVTSLEQEILKLIFT